MELIDKTNFAEIFNAAAQNFRGRFGPRILYADTPLRLFIDDTLNLKHFCENFIILKQKYVHVGFKKYVK